MGNNLIYNLLCGKTDKIAKFCLAQAHTSWLTLCDLKMHFQADIPFCANDIDVKLLARTCELIAYSAKEPLQQALRVEKADVTFNAELNAYTIEFSKQGLKIAEISLAINNGGITIRTLGFDPKNHIPIGKIMTCIDSKTANFKIAKKDEESLSHYVDTHYNNYRRVANGLNA